MRGCASFRNTVILRRARMSVHTHWHNKHHYASLLSKSQSQVPLKVTAITLIGSPNWSTASQMAPPSPYLTNISKTRGFQELPGEANKRNVAITMASSCSERLRCVPQGWLHLGGARMMLMLCLFDSDGVVRKEAYVRFQLRLLTVQLPNQGDL